RTALRPRHGCSLAGAAMVPRQTWNSSCSQRSSKRASRNTKQPACGSSYSCDPCEARALAQPRRIILPHEPVDIGVQAFSRIGQALHLQHMLRTGVAFVVAIASPVVEADDDPTGA